MVITLSSQQIAATPGSNLTISGENFKGFAAGLAVIEIGGQLMSRPVPAAANRQVDGAFDDQ